MRYPFFLLLVLGFFSCTDSNKKPEENTEERARRIHEKVVTIDTHDDINVKNFTDSINYTQNLDTQGKFT